MLAAPAPSLAPGTTDRVMDRLFPKPNPYVSDPVGWLRRRVGEWPWSKQREIAESVRDNRYTAVQSAHDTGKSYIASRIVAWWLDSHRIGEAFAVTSAPTDAQVKAILWREIRKAHRKAGLSGRITLEAHWYMGEDELVAYGRKPADAADPNQAMQAFQGIHARYVLVVLDEACGIYKWLFDAADSLATNVNARILAIGNPDDPAAHFATVCRPGSGWNNIEISAFDTPAFTGEDVPPELLDLLVSETWVNERKKRWGVGSPIYTSKVLGQFPDISDDTLIQPRWIREAQQRDLSGTMIGDYGHFGSDIARMGEDETVTIRVRGQTARVVYAKHKQDTVKTTGGLAKIMNDTKNQIGMNVDADGLGAGIFDNLKDMNLKVQEFHGAARTSDPQRYKNLRAECYWELREAFEKGEIDIDMLDDDLAAQLGSIKWFLTKDGKIQIESKDAMRKRGMPSPDRADALMMAWKRGGVINMEAFIEAMNEGSKTVGVSDGIEEMQF